MHICMHGVGGELVLSTLYSCAGWGAGLISGAFWLLQKLGVEGAPPAPHWSGSPSYLPTLPTHFTTSSANLGLPSALAPKVKHLPEVFEGAEAGRDSGRAGPPKPVFSFLSPSGPTREDSPGMSQQGLSVLALPLWLAQARASVSPSV